MKIIDYEDYDILFCPECGSEDITFYREGWESTRGTIYLDCEHAETDYEVHEIYDSGFVDNVIRCYDCDRIVNDHNLIYYEKASLKNIFDKE